MGTTPTKSSPAKVPDTTRTPDFVNPQLAAAMSHPTRVHTMSVLLERTASPRQVAAEIGERLNNVTYHVNQLRKLGCVELVRTERAQGGRVLEHFYRATQRLYFDEDSWQELGEKEQLDLSSVTLRMISQDIAGSMAAGIFFTDGNAHLSRQSMLVDEEGWAEAIEVLERASAELFALEARVAERTADGASADISAKVNLMQFRSPSPPEEDEPAAEDD
ncbi:MAG TPA: winged helix-turn-helix domain-containing protein [Solirubrobacterales bacterium]|nr:winged helix-turn-helix domain-containing protein [Solirubrobacterales bacterium]